MRRIATGVKTGNHDEGVSFKYKKQRVREAPQEGAANVVFDGWALPGIIAHPFDPRVKRMTEMSA